MWLSPPLHLFVCEMISDAHTGKRPLSKRPHPANPLHSSFYDTVSIKPSQKYYKSFDERVLFALIESHSISFKRPIIMIGVGGFFVRFFFSSSRFRFGFVCFGMVFRSVRLILMFVFMENQVFRASFIGIFTDALNLFWGGKMLVLTA